MRDHGFDLRAYAGATGPRSVPKLSGKLHFFAGDMDDFYLNLAVYEFEEWLRSVDPDYPAAFTYGRPKRGHSSHVFSWAEMVRRMGVHVKEHADPGDDPSTWHY